MVVTRDIVYQPAMTFGCCGLAPEAAEPMAVSAGTEIGSEKFCIVNQATDGAFCHVVGLRFRSGSVSLRAVCGIEAAGRALTRIACRMYPFLCVVRLFGRRGIVRCAAKEVNGLLASRGVRCSIQCREIG